MEALVLPFSFREFLRHGGHEPDRPVDRLTKAARSGIEKHLRAYLGAGGFPEALRATPRDRLDLLRGYVDAMLLRDVIERHAVSHPVALRWMVRQLLGNAGGAFSVHKFYNDLRAQGVPVAKDTRHAYLSHLEDAFVIRAVPIAAASERRRMVNPRKTYPVDPGLIPVFDRSGKANLGHALETVVALELERRGAELAYVRTADDREVDFLARYPDVSQQLIQVCADLDAPATRERREARDLAAHTPAHLHAPRRLAGRATRGAGRARSAKRHLDLGLLTTCPDTSHDRSGCRSVPGLVPGRTPHRVCVDQGGNQSQHLLASR